jgi:NAD-dependent dihydropyrimidine dehydrogenase PreA subunit
MPYVITEPCVGVCDTACVDVCPVDCIHPTKEEWPEKGYDPNNLAGKQLYINPEECIDCGACEPACPVQAIFPEDEVPEKWKSYIQKNRAYYGL